jgi:predicted GTPase
LVGRTSSGKSSLGNALTAAPTFDVGIEHGTTSRFLAVPFRGGFQLQDTPGLLDGDHCSGAVLNAAKASALVILLTTGQLYRQEIDFLGELCTAQAFWNRTRGTLPRRDTLVFLNAADLKERTMPTSGRANELAALKTQVSPWLEREAVLSGAAAPLDGGPPWIGSLEGYLAHFCRQSAAATSV